jgi:hypothetical protein
VKGNVYKTSVEYYSLVVPGGLAEVYRHLDGEHRAFFDRQFLAMVWYDALPLLQLSQAAALARGMSHYAAARERGAFQAEEDIAGIYSPVLKVASPELAALRIGRVLAHYFDFGRGYSQIARPRSCDVVQCRVPLPLIDFCAPIAEGFIGTVLSAAGAKDVRFTVHPPTQDGLVERTPTLRVHYEVAWS